MTDVFDVEGIIESCWHGSKNVGFRIKKNPDYFHFPDKSTHKPPIMIGQYVKGYAIESPRTNPKQNQIVSLDVFSDTTMKQKLFEYNSHNEKV